MPQEKKYEVKVNVQVIELSKAGSGIKIEINSEDGRLGTVEIGHGSFGWRKGRESVRLWEAPLISEAGATV